MILSWIVGSGGLLGSALSRELDVRPDTRRFAPAERFRWKDTQAAAEQIAQATAAFATQAGKAHRWEVYWAAGLGTMSSPAEAFAPERSALSVLLDCLHSSAALNAIPGAIAFASSAGAIYGGSREPVITEESDPQPTTAYARAKLDQEDCVRAFASAADRTALVARISTVYGPGQALDKPQGLLTHIARRIITNQPVHIYVPYDTIRDYIEAADAAIATVNALRALKERGTLLKIIASEHPTTIAEILSVFNRITRRRPLIITSASKLSATYSRRVQFKSVVPRDAQGHVPKSLIVGIHQLMMAERLAFGRPADSRNTHNALPGK